MGVTDGSDAPAGTVGEYVYVMNTIYRRPLGTPDLWTPFTTITHSTGPNAGGGPDPNTAADWRQLGVLNLAAGDWLVGATADWWMDVPGIDIREMSVQLNEQYPNWFNASNSPDAVYWSSGVEVPPSSPLGSWLGLQLGPIRISRAAPTQVFLNIQVITPAGVTTGGAQYIIWARRMR